MKKSKFFVDVDDNLELIHVGYVRYVQIYRPSPFIDFDGLDGVYRLLHVDSKEHVLFDNMPDDVVTRLQDDIEEYSYVAVITLRQCPTINWKFKEIRFPESGGSNLVFEQNITNQACLEWKKAYIFRYSDVK